MMRVKIPPSFVKGGIRLGCNRIKLRHTVNKGYAQYGCTIPANIVRKAGLKEGSVLIFFYDNERKMIIIVEEEK